MQNLQPTPVTGPVTEAERTYAVESLRVTQAGLHQSLAGLSAAQLSYKPGTDRWSIAECAEHIVLVEGGIFAAIRKGMSYPANPDKRTDIRVSDVDVIKAVRSRAVTLAAPDPFVPTGRFATLEATLHVFDQQRDAVAVYVQEEPGDFRTHYFRHIALGWLDVYQAILLIAAHSERHRKQIDEVKGRAGYPA